MPTTSFPLVRGRTMRVTRVDGCCVPDYGDDNAVVTEGFVSVALTANINEPEEIVVTNASGRTCVRDAGCAEFQGYSVEITFCEVSPCLFAIVTGQPSVLDVNGDVVGFRMNSNVNVCETGFALEVWMGVPGVACAGEAGGYGYLLLPCLQGGVIGDFTIENAAITFTITGSSTKDGNGWANGPYSAATETFDRGPMPLGDGVTAGALPDPLDTDDHLYVAFTTVGPPSVTDGCVALVVGASTAATAGTPGTWGPAGSTRPANFTAANTAAIDPVPSTAWTTGQYVQGSTAGASGEMFWNGTTWATGRAT
jgi:hypothetical protein